MTNSNKGIKNKLVRNLLSNQVGFIVPVFAAFFLSPYIVHTLGDALYGIWSLIMSFTGHYGLLAVGIQGATTRHIAFSLGKNDYEKMNSYISSALWFLLPAAMLCIVAGTFIVLLIGRLFRIEAEYLFEAQAACFIVSVTIAITFAFVIFRSILTAHQRFDSLNLIRTSTVAVRSLLTVLMLSRGYKIVGLALLGLGVILVSNLFLALMTKSQCQSCKISLRNFSKQSFKTLLGYGVKAFTGHVALALVYQCDLMVIALFLPPEKITIYSLGATLLFYITQFNNAIVHVFDPYATRLYARGGIDALRPFYLQGSRFIYIMAGIIVAGCLSFGKPFFSLWIDPEHVESAVILWILVVPQLFGIGARFGHCLLVATARIGVFNIVAVTGGITNLVLSLILVQFWGIRGVAVGTLIPMIIIDGVWFIPYIARITGIQTFRIYFRSVGPGLLVAGIGSALGFSLVKIIVPHSWILLVVDIFIMLIGCGICAFFLLPEKLGETPWKQLLIQKIPLLKRYNMYS